MSDRRDVPPRPAFSGGATGAGAMVLQDQEERLRALVAALPGGVVFVVDHALRYLLAEGEALAAVGLSSATFVAKTIDEVWEPELVEQFTRFYRQALAGTPFAHDHELLGRVFHSRGAPLRSSDGRIYAALVVSYDITERRKVENELRRSEARLALAAAVASLALIEVDYRAQQARLSREAAALYGLGSAALSVSRERLHATFHPDDRGELARQIAESLDPEGRGWFAHEHRVVWPDGEVRWLSVRKQVLFDHTTAPAQPASALLVARDITARKRRELTLALLAELQAMLTRLSAIDEMLPVVGARVSEHLAVTHCLFVEISGAAETAAVFYDHHAPDVPDLVGSYRLAAFHTPAERAQLAAGQPIVIADVGAAPRSSAAVLGFAALHIRALITAPYVRDGQWIFALSVQHRHPRSWRADEVELVQELVAQLYPRIERARAEAALRASEERFRSVFEAIDEGFCIVECLFDQAGRPVDYRFLEVNPAFVTMTGLANAVGRTARELVPGLEPFWIETYGRVARTGEPVRFEQASEPMGRWFDVHASRIGGTDSRRVAIVFTNITARKYAEQQIVTANYRSQLAEAASHSFTYEWEFDSGRVTRSANLARVLGYRPDDLAPTWEAWAERIHPDDRTLTSEAEARRSVEASGDAMLAGMYRVRHRDGHDVWLEERTILIRDEHGRVRRLIGQATDISERKAAEAERAASLERERQARQETEQALAQAQEATRERDLLISIAAHDLRTPLTVILGQAQLLQRRLNRGGADAKDVRTAATIAEQAQRLNTMILALLDLSRIQEGRLTIAPAALDVGALLTQVVEAMQATTLAHSIRFQPPPVPVMLHGDGLRLEQVFLNLLGNAVKYSPDGGTIAVWMEQSEQRVVIHVQDEGIGIPAEEIPRLFSRFYRASNATRQATSSLGVGLYIVRELVLAHGGSIAVQSREGQGSTFVVTLPLHATPLEARGSGEE